jgi:hypothetical protein
MVFEIMGKKRKVDAMPLFGEFEQKAPNVASHVCPLNSDWIKTKKSGLLPPIFEDVLVVVHVDGKEAMVDMAFWDGMVWRASGFPDWKVEPLAWMSMPKLPDDV